MLLIIRLVVAAKNNNSRLLESTLIELKPVILFNYKSYKQFQKQMFRILTNAGNVKVAMVLLWIRRSR